MFPLDYFARKYYCKHARLNQLRSDKKRAKKAARIWRKMELRDFEAEHSMDYHMIRSEAKDWPDYKIKLFNDNLTAHGKPIEKIIMVVVSIFRI